MSESVADTGVEWLDLRNPETEGTTRIPNDPGVLTFHEARGWEVYTPEPPGPSVAPKDPADPSPVEATWVTLFHPLVKATHDFPNNAAALEGAYEAGWEFPSTDTEETPEPETVPTVQSQAPKTSRKTKPSGSSDDSPEGN